MKRFSVVFMLVATLLMSCGKEKGTGNDDNNNNNNNNTELLVPTVSTSSVYDITSSSAICGGNVESDGGSEVTERGIIYSCSDEPDNDCMMKVENGSGLGEFACEIIDLESNTTYYVKAYATNKVGTSYGEEVTFTTLDPYNGYEYVDLGLPSGTKWASHNIGAKTPYEDGNYYAWGDPKVRIQYNPETCPTYGVEMGDISGNPDYDVATILWGGNWRMPTEAEARELKDKCTWEWTEVEGKKGAIVTGPNGNQIFLPGAGFIAGTEVGYYGDEGAYWVSAPDPTDPIYFSTFLYFYSNNLCNVGWFSRYAGLSVRPVAD